MAVLVALYAVCSFTGDRIGEALGNREHDLAEGVRDVWLAGWFLTGPTTRRTVVVVALAALPVSLSLAYLF